MTEQTTGEVEVSRESGYITMAIPSSRADSMPVPIRASSTEGEFEILLSFSLLSLV